uniref:Uncharacterized protein n=1 Tax=Rhizophora mucronata TaxID=61149 RepID=A0A2P2QVW7_RHIMU
MYTTIMHSTSVNPGQLKYASNHVLIKYSILFQISLVKEKRKKKTPQSVGNKHIQK